MRHELQLGFCRCTGCGWPGPARAYCYCRWVCGLLRHSFSNWYAMRRLGFRRRLTQTTGKRCPEQWVLLLRLLLSLGWARRRCVGRACLVQRTGGSVPVLAARRFASPRRRCCLQWQSACAIM